MLRIEPPSWLALIVGVTMLAGCPENTEDTGTPDGSDTNDPAVLDVSDADVVAGGRMWDKWWVISGDPEPSGTFALYETTEGAVTGADTHRCKECHGWDYRGVDGAYATGSHFSGVAGVLGSVEDRTDQELFDLLKSGMPPSGSTLADGAHAFPDMSDEDVENLVLFLMTGLVDVSSTIDLPTKAVDGDALAGADHYAHGGAGTCATCHGDDGTDYNFGDESEPEYVGTVGAGNPWEMMHKIRWGHPGAFPQMPSGVEIGLTFDQQVDIAAHTQTLPQ
jgi:thiosulfate dehydrogenase